MSKEQWNISFSNKEFVYGEIANEFIQEKSKTIPAHSNVVCLAEGEGRNAVYLTKLGHDVTAYDQSEIGLEKAQLLASENDVEMKTVVMDLTKESVPIHTFDAGVLVFGHVPKDDQPFLLENLIQSVKPGGRVMFEVYSEKQLSYHTGGPGNIDLLYHPVQILSMIEPYICEHFYYGEVVRHEGSRHTGTCHVIQVVLRV